MVMSSNVYDLGGKLPPELADSSFLSPSNRDPLPGSVKPMLRRAEDRFIMLHCNIEAVCRGVKHKHSLPERQATSPGELGQRSALIGNDLGPAQMSGDA